MITVRPATFEDANFIIDFQQKMAHETEGVSLDIDTLTRGLEELFEDASKGKYYVAVDGDNVIGCLMTTYEWSEWRCGNVLWIQSVYIVQSHRGKGVFKKMYKYMQALVSSKDSGYRGIRLYVDKTNTKAQQVYEKLGMNGEHYQVFEWML